MRHVCAGVGSSLAAGVAAVPVLAIAQPAQLAPDAGALIVDRPNIDEQLAPPRPAPPPPAGVTDAGEQSAPEATLKSVRLEGGTRLQAQIDRIAAPFLGRPLQASTIKAVADAVSAAYAESGLALYTVAVPRQSLAEGILVLRVAEGHIGEVSIAGSDTHHNELVRAYAERLTRERPLTRATLERYMSLIRDIPGLKVEAQLLRGQTPGAVRLSLKLDQDRVRPLLSFNTRGTPRLGTFQAQGAASLYSVFRQGDAATAVVALPFQIERFQYASLAYATPLGSDGLVVQGTLSHVRTRPEDPPIEGDATSAGVQLSYPLIRGYRKNLYVSAGLDGLNSDNSLFGLTFTSDHTRAFRAGLSYSALAERRRLSISATGSIGLDALGARTDLRLTDAEFRKLTLSAGVDQALGRTLTIRLKGVAQASSKRLPATEQLPLGGDAFGRAFQTAAGVGDRGYGGSLELAWTAKAPWPQALQGSELFGFVDGGRVWTRDRSPFLAAQELDMASAGGGVRLLVRRKLVIGVEGAKALDPIYPDRGRPWRVILSWRSLL